MITLRTKEDLSSLMQLPKKITPDSIREAVVEIRYMSKVPYEVLIGLFFRALNDSFRYTNRPVQAPNLLPGMPLNNIQELTIRLAVQSLFYNNKISILILPNAFVFNCLNQYIGWHDYRPQIEQALKLIAGTDLISEWQRVGLRYVTEYPKKDLRECIKFTFTFGFPDVQSVTTAFRSEFEYHGKRVALNLNNKMPLITAKSGEKQSEIVPTSVIDIDVIADNLNIQHLDELLNVIDDNHEREKEIYFGMLTQDFLESLKPEY
jgi:uncharacterized protein (TIGR04255 family)